MDNNGKVQLSPEASTLFQEGISLVLSRWSTLQLAVENEWGGRNSRDKALQLASDLFNWFTQTKAELYVDDLEGLLDEALISLNTEAEDGSVEEVAYHLMIMNEQCIAGNYESIQKLRAASAQRTPVQHIRQASNDDEEDDDDDDMMMDASDYGSQSTSASGSQSRLAQRGKNETEPQRALEAEDGWETVSRKSRGRRN